MITKTESGLIHHESEWSSIPSWLTVEEDTSGRVTASGRLTITLPGDSNNYGYVVLTNDLADTEWVIRARSQFTQYGGAYRFPIAGYDSDTRPSGPMTYNSGEKSMLFGYTNHSGNTYEYGIAHWGNNLWGPTVYWLNVWLLYEIASSTNTHYLTRYRDDFSDLITGSWVHDFTHKKWFFFGFPYLGNGASMEYSYIQIFKSPLCYVSGLSSGNAVGVYDSFDNLIGSGEEIGGTAEVNVSQAHLPIDGYIVCYTDNTLTIPLTDGRYPPSGTSDIWGGDRYQYSATPPPSSGNPPWIISDWSSLDGMPASGRFVGEDGTIYNFDESGRLVPIGKTAEVPSWATGRFIKEDSTVVNIADALERRK